VPAVKHPSAVAAFGVAKFKVPAVLTQAVSDVSAIAPAQSSLGGGACVTQILNVFDALLVLGSV